MRSLLLLALLSLSGCTAARGGYAVIDAQRAYKEAVDEGAEEYAVYSITLAHEYLMKAREEVGYSDYGAADKLCQKAKIAASKAAAEARTGGVKVEYEEILPESEVERPSEPTTTIDDEEEVP
jgi:hypothetical protein